METMLSNRFRDILKEHEWISDTPPPVTPEVEVKQVPAESVPWKKIVGLSMLGISISILAYGAFVPRPPPKKIKRRKKKNGDDH